MDRGRVLFRKYTKWVIGGVTALIIGISVAMYQRHVKNASQYVKITSEPGDAQVWIDGVLQGKTTPGDFRISKGKTTILIGIQKKGFQLVQQTRKVSDLTAAPIVFQLEPDKAVAAISKVLLNTEPPEVKVSLNGNQIKGATPLELQLEVGKTYKLKFQKEGYNSKETTLTVDVPGALEKTVYLSPVKKEIEAAMETKISPPAQLGSPGKKVISPGSISVTSNPWAYLYMDDKKVGETPIVSFSTTPGKHILR